MWESVSRRLEEACDVEDRVKTKLSAVRGRRRKPSVAPPRSADERAPAEWHAVPVTTDHWRRGAAAESSASSLGALDVEVLE